MKAQPTYEELLTEIANLKKELANTKPIGNGNKYPQLEKEPIVLKEFVENKFETELIQQEALIDNAIFPVLITTPQAKVLYMNKACYDFFDFPTDIDLETLNPLDYWVYPENRALYIKQIQENGAAINFENYLITTKKEIKTVLQSASYIKFNQEIQIFSIIYDISESKKLENDLIKAKEKAEESEIQLKYSQKVARIGYYIYNVQTGFWSSSEMLDEIFGIDNEFVRDVQGWLNIVHPDFQQEMINYLAVNVLQNLEPFNKVYQIINKKSNSTCWVQGLGTLEFDANGKLLKMFGTIQDISASKNIEQELIAAKEKAEQSDERHRNLLDTMYEGVTLNELIFNQQGEVIDYRILEANASFDLHSTIKRVDVVGKLATDVYNMPTEYITQFWTDNLKNNKLITTDYYYEPNGRWTRVFTSPVQANKFTVTLFDITEQKNAEELIKQKGIEVEMQNLRLESLLKISQLQTNSVQELLDFALNEAINLTNSKIGYIYFYNEETKQFILNTWSKKVMKEYGVMNPQSVYDLEKNGIWGETVRQRKPIVLNDYFEENPLKKGTPHGPIALKKILTIPVIFDNKIVAVAGVANKETDYNTSDIRQLTLLMDSVWKMSERLLLISDLQKAKEKAEESDRLKSAFLHNMSHEVRTPLNAISGFSQLITRPNQPSSKLKKFADIITNSSNKLNEIITDVIEMSQIQSKVSEPKLASFNLITTLETIAGKFTEFAKLKNIDFKLNITVPATEQLIFSDKEKIERIITHLIDNAIKFTSYGRVQIGCETNRENFNFTITDTGIGISDEMQKVVFEPFRQVETGICRNYGGNGLGLSLAKAYLELLNGSISLQSEINKGTSISFTVPANRGLLPSYETKPANKQFVVNTLLIVEDEYSNYQYLLALLDDIELKILYAENGQQAVDLCKTTASVDLILMDIKMPIMDGFTAAKLIKAFRPDLPIIAQTAYALESEQQPFAGVFDDYLTKPIDGEVFMKKTAKYINTK